jgi:ATP-binding cassette subfamily B protein
MDHRIVERYTSQPARLPSELRSRIERAWGGAPVELYALADLDHALRLAESWLALGRECVAVAQKGERGEWQVRTIQRSHIREVRESQGLSANTLVLHGLADEPPLALLRFTHRQRLAFESIRAVLEEALAGRTVRVDDADRVYADAVARPIRDAQALIARRRGAVVLRLLAYLKPYRKPLTLGMSAAAVITLVSLVPPYLAGYLIDRVVRPAQEGRLSTSTAANMAWIAVMAMATLYVVRQTAALIRLRLMSILGELVARDLRSELYEHIQRLSLSFFSRKKTGSLITRVTADTDRLWEFLAFGVVDVSLSIVMLLGLGVVLLTLDWRLGLVMVLPVPLFCWLIYWHGESLNRLFLRGWRKWSAVTDVLSDTIPGIRVVKAFSQEAREIGRFGERNDERSSIAYTEVGRRSGLS